MCMLLSHKSNDRLCLLNSHAISAVYAHFSLRQYIQTRSTCLGAYVLGLRLHSYAGFAVWRSSVHDPGQQRFSSSLAGRVLKKT
jgi:regulatory protein YycI of two-component signal transduction system YycFG